MKQNTFTKLMAAGIAGAFALGTAMAQQSDTTTTTTAGAAGVASTTSSTSTSTMDGTGTLSTFSPDSNMMTVRTTTSSAPATYYFTKQTTVVDPTGQTVQMSSLRPDMPVSYTYSNVDGRMVVTKVTLQKPISFYEKKETTTTTTTTNPNP
jgi:hypothetical protein